MSVLPASMNEERFWALVTDAQGDVDHLKRLLMRLSRDDILAFDLRLDDVMYLLDRRDIHDMTDGSNDGFEYVRLWIVSQGRDYFEAVLSDPQRAPHDADEQENEEFGYAAMEAYQERFDATLPDTVREHRVCTRSTQSNKAGWSQDSVSLDGERGE